MTNTALGAENNNSRIITFKSKEHEKFYMEYLEKCRYQDVYHQALVYCLGIDRDTRENVNKIYNFKTGCVKTESLQEGWQTSGSLRIVRMAFNLYCNGTPSVGDYEAEDADCKNLITKLPATDANGEASAQIVKTQDTVYLKEITAPSGYRINATAYNVKLEVSKTTSCLVPDIQMQR